MLYHLETRLAETNRFCKNSIIGCILSIPFLVLSIIFHMPTVIFLSCFVFFGCLYLLYINNGTKRKLEQMIHEEKNRINRISFTSENKESKAGD